MSATTQQPSMTKIESYPCNRCRGTGRFGPVCVYGGICFTCNGRKVILTNRGFAASQYLVKIRSVTVPCLVSGMKIRMNSITNGGQPCQIWTTVKRVTANEDGTYRLETDHCDYLNMAADTLIRVAQTAEQKKETLLQALLYQDTLAPDGKPK